MRSANIGDFQIRKLNTGKWILEKLATIGNPACGANEWAEIDKFPNLKLAAENLARQENHNA